ncbi:TIGR02587 family membrane protein [soil metagenome]
MTPAMTHSGSLSPHTWRDEIVDLVRGVSGACIFAISLIYTFEMWSRGASLPLWHLLIFLSIAISMNFLLDYFAGFKLERSPSMVAVQAIEALAIGIVTATIMLLALGQIAIEHSLRGSIGKIVLEAIPLSIGLSIANSIFGQNRERVSGTEDDDLQPKTTWHELANDIGATTVGGVFIAVSIAPTDEVPFLATQVNGFNVLALTALSLLIPYGIVFVSGFQHNPQNAPFQTPLSETAICYLVSLLVSLVVLALFGHIGLDDSLHRIVALTVVMTLPTSIGGAAGRLLV